MKKHGVGEAIKVLAIILGALTGSVSVGIGSTTTASGGYYIILVGIFSAFFVALFFYGFGELISNSQFIAEHFYNEQQKDNKRSPNSVIAPDKNTTMQDEVAKKMQGWSFEKVKSIIGEPISESTTGNKTIRKWDEMIITFDEKDVCINVKPNK